MDGVSAGERTLEAALGRVEALALQPVANAAELEVNLAAIYREFFGAEFANYEIASLKASAAETMQRLFQLRLGLRRQIPQWAERNWMTRPVQRALRDVFRVTRYASEMLGETAGGFARLGPTDPPRRAFTGRQINTLVNPAFATGHDLPFRSGDVIVVRGKAHNSAAIARIGDIDSQFSHVGIVHVDARGNASLVEALIEDGAVVTPLAEALDHGIGRAILFRHKDPDVAARAAEAIRAHVAAAGEGRILYDFTMALDGYDRLYCAKLVRLAYSMATGGRELLPRYTTRLDMQNRDFLNRVGVKVIDTFAPGDVEIDPRFEIVAEWADYRATSSLRNQDLIMTMLFDAMEAHGYRFREDFSIRMIALLGRISAHFSDRVKRLLSAIFPRVPVNMKRKTVAVIAMLHHTAEPILERIDAADRESVARHGRPLHPRQVLALLDEHRRNANGKIGYLFAPGH